MSLQTTHNTTTTSLQRELDQLRQEYQKTKENIRELEMGNDDLERNEHWLIWRTQEEEGQLRRLKDELRGICFSVPMESYLTIILLPFQMPT
jgi:septal ring factor EnvC (AmiA/AmiB activator)